MESRKDEHSKKLKRTGSSFHFIQNKQPSEKNMGLNFPNDLDLELNEPVNNSDFDEYRQNY